MERLAFAVLSVSALFAIGAASAVVSCPSDEDLAPCTCKRMSYGLHVVCANIEDSAILARAFKVLRGYQLESVLLYGIKIADILPNDLFSGLNIAKLTIDKSNLEFKEPAFKGLEESLKVLRVVRSKVESPEEDELAKLVKLEELVAMEVPIRKITDETFNGKIPNVRMLILDDGEITSVSNKAFAELHQLRTFSAADNGIKEIVRTMGPIPVRYLESLDFSRNELTELPDDIFSDSPALTTLIFNGNKLKTVSEAVWSTMFTQANEIYLSDNGFVCDERMDWLKNTRWPSVVTGHCVSPSSKVGKSLEEVYKPKM